LANAALFGLGSSVFLTLLPKDAREEIELDQTLSGRITSETRKNEHVDALLVLLFFVVRQMAKNRQKKQKLEKELQAVEEERIQLKLKDQENSLTNLALELLQKRETSDDLVQKINLLLKKEDQTIKTELISILREAKTNAHRQPDIQYEDSDAVVQLQEFQQRLRKVSPTISKSEMELSTYVRMNLSNKEIAAIRNCTENTIKTARHRLKKRLGLSPEESLAKFVMDI
jgi:DNA-binding CsgD family transcriptional regulator